MLGWRERPGDRGAAVEKARQIDGEFGGRLVAIAWPLRQALAADGDKIGVDPRHDAVSRLRLDVEHAPVDGLPRPAAVDATPRQESVEDEAEGMDVGPGIHRAALRIDLLRGHPLGRPQHRADLGGGVAGGIVIDVVDRSAEAEVAEFHPLAPGNRCIAGLSRSETIVGREWAVVTRHEKNVPRLDVAVEDTDGMGGMRRLGERQDDAGGNRGGDGAGMAIEIGGEAFAAQFLGDVRESVVLPHLMNDDDIRMRNLRGVLRLAEKPLRFARVEEDPRAGNLQCLAADELRVDHLEDLGEAPLAEFVNNAELADRKRRRRLRLPRRHHPEEKERVEPFGQLRGDRGIPGIVVIAGRGKPGQLIIDRRQSLDGGVIERRWGVTGFGIAPRAGLRGRIVGGRRGKRHGDLVRHHKPRSDHLPPDLPAPNRAPGRTVAAMHRRSDSASVRSPPT